MTLNQVLGKISSICLSHQQIRSFFEGAQDDWLNDRKTKYPAVLLLQTGGLISVGGQSSSLSFTMFLADLVNVSEDTKTNVRDVQSDMFSVAQDIIAQLARPENDWSISTDENVTLYEENENDLQGGVQVDFSLRFQWSQNICQIPTDFASYTPNSTDMNVYDLTYIGLGTEGSTLTLDAVKGKKIMLITRESGMLYKVSALPDTAEYTWDGTTITFGLAITLGARFLILYRNY